jgi:hypothetical protein
MAFFANSIIPKTAVLPFLDDDVFIISHPEGWDTTDSICPRQTQTSGFFLTVPHVAALLNAKQSVSHRVRLETDATRAVFYIGKMDG